MSETNVDETKPCEARPRKMVRNVAIALGIACFILIAGLIGAMAYYTKAINDRNVQYDSYIASHSHSDSEYNALASQNLNLQAQVKNLQAPDVLKVNLTEDDINSPRTYLHIYGYLFNAGNLTATDVKLHVVLYSLDALVNDTYVDVGSMGGRTWASVDANVIYGVSGYNGSLIVTDLTITPQWTANP